MNQELGNILHSIYQFSNGLNKTIFKWYESPKSLEVLAGTDYSGIVRWKGRKYHVFHDWKTSAIVIENM